MGQGPWRGDGDGGGPSTGRGDGWPDWRGRTVVVAASGPSQRAEDLTDARGRAVVVAINETWRLCPWAAALYACDARWWRLRGPTATAFAGLRIAGFEPADGCLHVGVARGVGVMRWAGPLGAGGNSGFQAINLAARCGATRIVLTGFDMGRGVAGESHWHGDHVAPGLTNPEAAMLRNSARLLDAAAPDLAARGVTVINASRASALTAYPRTTIEEALT